MNAEERLLKIERRQVARLIAHLKEIGYDRPEIFAAVKRSYGYTFEDVMDVVNTDEHKETGNED